MVDSKTLGNMLKTPGNMHRGHGAIQRTSFWRLGFAFESGCSWYFTLRRAASHPLSCPRSRPVAAFLLGSAHLVPPADSDGRSEPTPGPSPKSPFTGMGVQLTLKRPGACLVPGRLFLGMAINYREYPDLNGKTRRLNEGGIGTAFSLGEERARRL